MPRRLLPGDFGAEASIKSIPYDEFKDNDTLEKIAQELNEGGANVVVGSLDAAINWGSVLHGVFFHTHECGIRIGLGIGIRSPRTSR